MGTTADKLNKIIASKEAIRTSIANKGVDISSTTPLSEYSSKIDSISTGGTLVPNRYLEDSLTVGEDNIISGFSISNYFTFNATRINTSNWELNIKIKTPETFTSSSSNGKLYLLSLRKDTNIYGSDGRYGLHLYLTKTSDTNCTIGGDIANSSGNSWLLTAGGTGSISTAFTGGSIGVDTIYYIKMGYDGSSYSVKYSTDNTNFTTAISADTSSLTISTLLGNKIGIYGGSSALETPFSNGKVYLEDTYIKTASNIVWTGTRPAIGGV